MAVKLKFHNFTISSTFLHIRHEFKFIYLFNIVSRSCISIFINTWPRQPLVSIHSTQRACNMHSCTSHCYFHFLLSFECEDLIFFHESLLKYIRYISHLFHIFKDYLHEVFAQFSIYQFISSWLPYSLICHFYCSQFITPFLDLFLWKMFIITSIHMHDLSGDFWGIIHGSGKWFSSWQLGYHCSRKEKEAEKEKFQNFQRLRFKIS